MKRIAPQIKRKKTRNNLFSPSFLHLKDNVDQLGGEKLKIFYLLQHLRKDEFSFERSLEGAMTLLSHAEKSFIETRSDQLLIWLLERFSTQQELIPFEGRCTLYTFSHEIIFPFRIKEVLSLFIEVRNSSLDLEIVKKVILEKYQGITLVDGSFISVINQRDKVVKIHLEIQKEKSFSKKEVAIFQKTLPQAIENFLEKPQSQFIVPSNRELLIKSFQWIIKDLCQKDLPHVFIDFSRQTVNSFQFSVLVCRIRTSDETSLQQRLNHFDIHIEGASTYEERNSLKEGVIFTIDISASPCLSIIDARKRSYLLIQDLIGPFRDVNGGLLEKIENNFNLFCKEVPATIEDLKPFFYGITPQEQQAIAPISLLKKVYFSMKLPKLDHEIDYFVKEDENTICITIKTIHPKFEKEFRHLLLTKFSEVLIASTYTNDTTTISCALQKNDQRESERLKNLTFSFYNRWREKKELKQVLKLGCTTRFVSLDPRIGTEEEPSCFLKMLFEGLTRIGPEGFPEKALAEKIEISSSQRLYRFFLRKSYWSNKMPLTAYDFAYSWETSLSPNFSSPLSYLFYPIENAQAVKEGKLPPSKLGIHVIDDLTLEVRLQHSTPYFLELCAHSAFSPICKSVDTRNPSWPKAQRSDYICNGPFAIDLLHNKGITLRKNPLFWEKENVHLERVIVSTMTEKEALSLFQKKKLDALLYPFCKNQVLKSINPLEIQKKKCVTEIRYLSFNCLKVPFLNQKMRQAFSLAIQRAPLALSFSSEALPYYAPYSPQFTQLILNQANEENKALARRLFSESLEELQLKWDIISQEKIYATPRSQGISELISKQFNDLFGLKLRPIVVDASRLFSLIRKGKIRIYIYGWINRIQDPSYFLSTFSSPRNIINYPCWKNKKLNALNQSIQKTSCLETRRQLHYQAEEILYQEKPIIPLLSAPVYSMIYSNVHNIYVGDSQEFDIRYCHKK